MAATNQQINIAARHSIFVQRYAGMISREFQAVIDELKARIAIGMLQGGNEAQILANIEAIQTHIFSEYADSLSAQFIEFAQNELEFEVEAVFRTSGGQLTIPPDLWQKVITDPLIFPDQSKSFTLESFIKNWSDSERNRISGIIRTGSLLGETLQDIAKKVNQTLDKTTRRNNNAVVRTSINHISNQAKKALYDANQDIIAGHEWVAKIDSRTSDICKGLDGEIFLYDDDKPDLYPPAHPNCRSTTAAIFK